MTDHSGPGRPGIPPHSNPSWQFLHALPSLARITEELNAALLPAMTTGRDEDREFARAAWMLAKALRFLLDAAQADDPGAFDAALAEADTDALAVAGYLRSLRAAAALPDELAAVGEAARAAGQDLGECTATSATIQMMTRYGTADEIQVGIGTYGRVSWRSAQHGQQAVDGRTQLDLAAALDGLAAAYTRSIDH
jgi:hypothetical protein